MHQLFPILLSLFLAASADSADPSPTSTAPPAAPTKTAAAAAADADVTLTVTLVPAGVVDGRPTQLLTTVRSKKPPAGATLTIEAPPGFTATPREVALPGFEGEVTLLATLSASGAALLPGERVARVVLHDSAARGKVHAAQNVKFDFAPEIALTQFLWTGLLGVALGYLLRLSIQVLAAVGPPKIESLAVGQETGPIARWFKEHYYVVDGLVTAALGLIVLISMTAGGRPPQTGSSWYTAIAVGVGVGLFTNSELVTKVRR